MTKLEQFGIIVKSFRDNNNESQVNFATRLGSNRTAIAHLEQGRKLPERTLLIKIIEDLKIPEMFWKAFLDEDHSQKNDFEAIVCELVGKKVSLDTLSEIEIKEAQKHIDQLMGETTSEDQIFDNLNRCLIFYGIKKVSKSFYKYYLQGDTFKSIENFERAVKKYQKDAIRIFSTFTLAYDELNYNDATFEKYLEDLEVISLESYTKRNDWHCIESIPNMELSYLGYISAQKVKTEAIERTQLIEFIDDLITKFGGNLTLNREKLLKYYGIKKLNKMDSLLRKFNTKFEHSLLSSLFDVDIDYIIREKSHLAPKGDEEIIKMQATQNKAFANLTNYLTADYMDLYIATSMRTEGDFISVNKFVEELIEHDSIKKLKLRYFNPTQSWVEDRVSKGLVEALMLKRASVTIYMAQKSDTFGKDSEASVSLGQGKPVIVHVPKLKIDQINFDSEILANLSTKELVQLLDNNEDNDIDTEYDEQAILALIISQYLNKADDQILIDTVKQNWAEFDLESETHRINDLEERKEFRDFIEDIKNNTDIHFISEKISQNIKDIFIATTIRYEQRAKVFKEVHPLALQVILSTGVLNGILVSRSMESCAILLTKLLENDLELDLEEDENNYKLIEKTTGSVIRVISRNKLLSNAFEQFYKF